MKDQQQETKNKTEAQLLSSFKVYLETAALLSNDEFKQLRIADEVFMETHGYSWIGQFEGAFKKVIGKDLPTSNTRTPIVTRHPTGKRHSGRPNKGSSPAGYFSKISLCKEMNHRVSCPSSLTLALLSHLADSIKTSSYSHELEVGGTLNLIQVPCYCLDDCLTGLHSVSLDAYQKKKKDNKPSVMCHFPSLNADFRFNLAAYRHKV